MMANSIVNLANAFNIMAQIYHNTLERDLLLAAVPLLDFPI
jgi:hypothetical protein